MGLNSDTVLTDVISGRPIVPKFGIRIAKTDVHIIAIGLNG